MNASGMVRIEALGRDNYDTWRIQMKALLVKNDAWVYVSGGTAKPEPTEENAAEIQEWINKDEKAKSDLILSIGRDQLKLVKNCATSRALWLKLEETYASKGPARKASLLKNLTLKKMHDNDDVHVHLREFFDSVDKLAEMDITINDDLLAIMLLYSLPASYENFRVAIESRDTLPTPDNLRTKITEEYDARKNSNSSSSNQGAMYVQKKLLPKNKNGRASDDKKNQKGNTFSYKCFKCHEQGHKASECPLKRKNSDNSANVVLLSTEAKIDMCQNVSDITLSDWCLDSGCTSHLCRDLNQFTDVGNGSGGQVKLANNASAEIKRKGTAVIKTKMQGDSRDVKVIDVLHVPELRHNLLSVSKITDKGYKVLFDKYQAEIFDEEGDTKVIAKRVDDLYYVRGESSESCQSGVSVEKEEIEPKNLTQNWHKRMGHLNFRDLVNASKTGVIQGVTLPNGSEDASCDICLKGKMARPSFPKQTSRSTSRLEIIHTDLCGPMRIASNGGSVYLLTFIDDFSRWAEVRFLRNKSQVLEEFKSFKALVENKHEAKIKEIQSDNGREYVNAEFDAFLKSEGIKRRLTAPYTPQQNGVAERMNRTLIEMARCLLIQSGLPSTFWAEAVSTACHIRNRCPAKKIEKKTPYELWNDRVPNVAYFRNFGCRAFVLNKAPNKGKLDDRATEGIFVGYADQSKAYRIWLPKSRKIEITRDVRFIENCPAPAVNDAIERDWFDVDLGRSSTVEIVRESEQSDEEHDARESSDDEEPFLGFPPSIVQNEATEDGAGEDGAQDEIVAPNRRRGRPRIIRTGRPGRPRKDNTGGASVEPVTADVAEVSTLDAMSGSDSSEWKNSMASEVKSIIQKGTWEIVARPKNQRTIGSRFVLRTKYKADGTIEKRKARVVARGFGLRPEIDFHETFAPVARLSSIRTVVAVAVIQDMHARQLDISTAYLNGVIKERIFMEAPKHLTEVLEHIVENEKKDADIRGRAQEMGKQLLEEDAVLLLKKGLYGLPQAGRAWNERLDEELRKLGAVPSDADPCVYIIQAAEATSYIVIYVDDMVVFSTSEAEIDRVKNHLCESFEVKDLGELGYCLGLEFNRREGCIAINQKGYINEILEKYRMSDCNPVSTPLEPGTKLMKVEGEDACPKHIPYRELVGSLMYLSVGTRPDIAHAVSYLSQFNNCFGELHWKAAKRVLRYLKGTSDLSLMYSKKSEPAVMFTDADWGSGLIDRKSYTGYSFLFGGAAVSWASRKQPTVALSSTEAEYLALTEASKEAIYMRRLLKSLGVNMKSIVVKNDNVGAQKLSSNPVFHDRTKHVDIKHHFVRDVVKSGEITIEHVPTQDMVADVLTKGLTRVKHENCVKGLGLKCM